MVLLLKRRSSAQPWICSWISQWSGAVPAGWWWGSPPVKLQDDQNKMSCGTPYPKVSWQVLEIMQQVRGRNTPWTGQQYNTAPAARTLLWEHLRFSVVLAVFWDCGEILEKTQRWNQTQTCLQENKKPNKNKNKPYKTTTTLNYAFVSWKQFSFSNVGGCGYCFSTCMF